MVRNGGEASPRHPLAAPLTATLVILVEHEVGGTGGQVSPMRTIRRRSTLRWRVRVAGLPMDGGRVSGSTDTDNRRMIAPCAAAIAQSTGY